VFVLEFIKKILKVVSFVFALWLLGFGLFFFVIPNQVRDDQTTTESIVVLTGGRERLKTGFQLLCNQQAKLIFISGVNPEEKLKSLLKSVDLQKMPCAMDREKLKASTHLGYLAKNTKENAEETAAWVKQMGITSIRLVTAAYHMPRSLLQLNYLLPNVTIIPHPVFPYGHEKLWWWNEGAMSVIFSEYHKFMLGYIRTLFIQQNV
jgi:uncharacterized SAM-binding protein YcdF (DUF218 family)